MIPGTLFDLAISAGRQVEVSSARLAIRIRGPIERRRAGSQHLLDARRQRSAFTDDPRSRSRKIERVPQLEGSQRVGVAPAHGAVDLDNAVGDLRNHACGVNDVIAKQLPQQRPGAIRRRDQRPQPGRKILDVPRGVDRRKPDFLRRMILERLPVDRVDLLRGADALVETLPGLVPDPAALHHFQHEIGENESFAPRIVGGRFVEIARDVSPDVEADDIHQPVARALSAVRSAARSARLLLRSCSRPRP